MGLRKKTEEIADKDMMISKLKDEVEKLKVKQDGNEDDWKDQYDELLNSTKQKEMIHGVTIDQMQKTLNQKQDELGMMQVQLQRFRGDRGMLNVMNRNELTVLKADLEKAVENVENEEKRFQRDCVICGNRPKNVCFVDGCDHVAVCKDCVNGLQPRVCPICAE